MSKTSSTTLTFLSPGGGLLSYVVGSTASTTSWTLPLVDGINGQSITTNGSTVLSFSNPIASSVPFSGLTAATTTNSIDNLNFAQTWNWSTASTQNPLSITGNALTSGTLKTISSTSTAFTGKLLDITLSGNNIANIGTLLNITSSGVDSIPTLAKFNYAGTGDAINIIQTVAATALANNNSPKLKLTGTYWTGAASADDLWTQQIVLGTGVDPTTTISYAHSGSAGVLALQLPGTTGIKPSADSVTALQIRKNNGTSIVNFDTTNNRVGINSTAPTGDLSFGGASIIINNTTTNGAITLQTNGTGALTLDSGTTGNVNLGTGANAKTLAIGNVTGATAVNFSTGSGNTSFQTPTITMSNTGSVTSLLFAGNAGGNVGFKAPATVTTPVTWELPALDGSNTNVLQTNGSGVLSFVPITSGGSRLDQITAANTTSTIDSLNNAITWNWSTLDNETAFTYNFNALTSGTGIAIASSATAFTGSMKSITLSGSNAANTGTLLNIISSGSASLVTLAKLQANGAIDALNAIRTTVASSGVHNNSPLIKTTSTYWNGSASTNNIWTIQDVLGAGTSNPTSSITFNRVSGTTGALSLVVPNFTTIKAAGNNNFIVGGDGNTNTSTNISNTVVGGDSNSISGASGARGLVIGGASNTISATNHNNVVSGGASNSISGGCAQSGIFGGNSNSTTATNHWNFTYGGVSNTMSTGASHNVIVGGDSNTLSSATGGNRNSIVTSLSCTMSSTGENNRIIGAGSVTLAGTGTNTTILGAQNTAMTFTTPTAGIYCTSSTRVQYATYATPASGTTITAAESLNKGLTLTNGNTYTLPTAAAINTALGAPSVFTQQYVFYFKVSTGAAGTVTINTNTGGTRQSTTGAAVLTGGGEVVIALTSATTYDYWIFQ